MEIQNPIIKIFAFSCLQEDTLSNILDWNTEIFVSSS